MGSTKLATKLATKKIHSQIPEAPQNETLKENLE